MSNPIGTYTFLPWIRSGIANQINPSSTTARASIDISVDIEGTLKSGGTTISTVNRTVELYGPGDVIGVDSSQISRIEPENWITNFEPNYLAAIEFYDEDFPWRYSPATPDGHRLLPWLALVVLEEETEFKEGGNVANRPLSYIDITADFQQVFHDASEGWAWAHVHVNEGLSASVVEDDANKVAQEAQDVIDKRPDNACSRLLCPRKLKPKTAYHAFLVPAFESGRLAGLGHDPKPLFEDAGNGLSATSSSWNEYGVPANRPDATSFPFYHRWYFHTAERGDFESLVRLLKPKVVDSRVGHRDMDVTDPAPNIDGIEDPDLEKVLRLGGALKAPFETLDSEKRAEFIKYDEWAKPYPHSFQEQLSAFVNLADSYQADGVGANTDTDLSDVVQAETDPLITPPIYGRWHALTERLLTERDGSEVPNSENWVHDLNLDPRWRVSAGFGTKVIQQNQETYMEAAWDQVGDIVEANRRIRQAQMARAAGRWLHKKHVVPSAQSAHGKLLMLASPMKARVLTSGLTLQHQMLGSHIGTTMTSTAMRRAIRPSGKVAKRLDLGGPKDSAVLLNRANAGEVSAAPPRQVSEEIFTPDELADAIEPKGLANELLGKIGQWVGEHFAIASVILALVIVLVLLLLGLGVIGIGVAAVLVVTARQLWKHAKPIADQQTVSQSVKEEQLTPETVEEMSGSEDFRLVPHVDPRISVEPRVVKKGEEDNDEAVRFKASLSNQYKLIEKSASLADIPAPVPLDLRAVSEDIREAIRPELTIPRWVLSGINIPARILDQVGEDFVEAMVYPEFDTPMYEPLAKAGTDLFVPNLHLVESDSVTLLETNQKFIESYMVGLNHEFARELLWREYMTDQRGSYFRQFWDVRKKIAAAEDKQEAREKFKDIKPLHKWPKTNDLGDNDNREEGSEPEEELVLVIRGELLKKYPNTVISAQPAKWQTGEDDEPDKKKERVLDESVEPITPLYEARIHPDIYFFGFDLTALEARGDDTVDDKPGWFFRIEEVPGDARFGFDVSRDPGTEINVWNDLAWGDIVPLLADGVQITVADIPSHSLVKPTAPELQEKLDQWDSDQHVRLNSAVSSAELAYVALQTPVIMAVHASELLPDQGNGNA